MNIGIIKSTVCVNSTIFDDLETAEEFLSTNVWPGADAVAELPDGYGIGDICTNGVWSKPEDLPPDVETLRSAKLAEVSAATEAAVYAGCTVQLPSTGEDEHFSLTLKDQIDLSAAFTAVTNGAPYYPYHSDTLLCRLYPAEDIMVMGKAATAHVLYHTTYCNHLNIWIRRAETEEELEAIFYGAELPEDLAENLGEVLQFAQSM
jgi:hypothetical protein